MFLSELCEKDTADLNVYPLLPDLVGEFSFINIFYNISSDHKRKWYKIFCSEKHQDYFCSFLRRCLDDWNSLEFFKDIIRESSKFVLKNNCNGFIEKCVNIAFFTGLSYYYKLSKKDLLYLKNILLNNKDEKCYLEYSFVLLNSSYKMPYVNDKLLIAEKIKDEILSKYNTAKVAEVYIVALSNA